MAKRGRPVGYRLSKESKELISEGRKGVKHSEKTKEKISKGVKRVGQCPVSIDRVMVLNLKTAHTIKVGKYMSVYIPATSTEKGKWMRHHVVVMEQHLGRKLKRGEQVHHWGDKCNNEVELLTVCKNIQHHAKLNRVKRNIIKHIKGGE